MSEIFKIYQQQNNDVIDKIIVFIGDLYVDDIDNLFTNESTNDIFKDVFSDHEMKNITDNNILVTFTKQRLYLDDSIEIEDWYTENLSSNEVDDALDKITDLLGATEWEWYHGTNGIRFQF